MYSLPITTYSDYWRKTKSWSAYFGSIAVLVASTRYYSLEDIDLSITAHRSLQLATVTQNSGSKNFLKQGLYNQGEISRGMNRTESKPMQDDNDVEAEENMLGNRMTSKIEILNKEIPYDTKYIESDELPPGASRIQEKGVYGVRREVVKIFKVDGQPVDQQVQSFFELDTPKQEVIIRNTKPLPKKKVIITKPQSGVVEGDLSKLNIVRTLDVEATAYTYTGNNTATGVKPREGLIAVDPKVIAMGTRVYVEGYGYAVAADTGGAIRGNRIDVFFSTLRQCMDWGRRPVRIHILNST